MSVNPSPPRGLLAFLEEQELALVAVFGLFFVAYWFIWIIEAFPPAPASELVEVAGAVEYVDGWYPTRRSKRHALLQLRGTPIRLSTDKLDVSFIRTQVATSAVFVRALVQPSVMTRRDPSPIVQPEALWLNNGVVFTLSDSEASREMTKTLVYGMAWLARLVALYVLLKAYAAYKERRE